MKINPLDVIIKDGFKKGDRLSLVLFDGCEYYDGYTPAPTTNMQGYDPSEDMTEEPGRKTTGYVVEFSDHEGEDKRVVLTNVEKKDSRQDWAVVWYVDSRCIHSFSGDRE